MAEKPRMTVRLAPSILHALDYLAEREAVAPAELARVQSPTAACQTALDRHGWRGDFQRDYMRWLDRRALQERTESDLVDDAADIDVDGEPELATPARPVE